MNTFKIVLLISSIALLQARVLQITSYNIQLILRSMPDIYLLLHNPNCKQSKQYQSKFLNVKNIQNLGIVDCQKQKSLCDFMNTTHFPTLLYLKQSTVSQIDQQQFLVRQNLIDKNDQKAINNRIIKRLINHNLAIIILQQQGLPPIDKIQNNQQLGVYYITNPSKIHSMFLGLNNGMLGCWILARVQNKTQKYYCGNGYKSKQILKYINNYKQNKLKPYDFSNVQKDNYITTQDLQILIKQKDIVKQTCKYIYFYSKKCEHCNLKDIKTIKNNIKKDKNYQVKIFDSDVQFIPSSIKLRRLPQMIQFCQGEMNYFGNIFTNNELIKFMTRNKNQQQREENQL